MKTGNQYLSITILINIHIFFNFVKTIPNYPWWNICIIIKTKVLNTYVFLILFKKFKI